MKRKNTVITWGMGLLTIVALGAFSGKSPKMRDVKVGSDAPDFTATDSNGKQHKLSQYKGKYVVLEWLNHGCPYVRKHYDSGNMQKTQAALQKDGAVWFSVVSSAPGKQGYMTPEEANQSVKEHKAKVDAVLLDKSGEIGKKYGAKTTPHMFLIDPKGKIVYQGAIDSIRSTKQSDVKKAENYVLAAFASVKSGKPVKTASTDPYGCSVKYKN